MSSQYKCEMMDLSFDIQNNKGDQVRVALSYYDTESLQSLSEDPYVLALVFYDVTLVRIWGEDTVGIKTLTAICDVLFRFMNDNDNAVLCFYCDDVNEVTRHHMELTPQEYRSRLFSRMFDMYIKSKHITDMVNYVVEIDDNGTPRFAHFITSERHLYAVKLLEHILMAK